MLAGMSTRCQARDRHDLHSPRLSHESFALNASTVFDPHRNIARHFESRWERGYVNSKLRMDPVYAAALRTFSGSSLPLLDIGCGMGLLGMYLAEHGKHADYIGVDSDPRKIASGSLIAAQCYPHMHLVHGDAGSLPEFSGNVAILDALHYMPASLQQCVLNAAAQRVAPGGALLIRNCLRDSSWRYWATVFEEKLLHWSRWMQVAGDHFPSRNEITAPLATHGLDVDISPLWGRTPYNSYMVIGRRPYSR